MRNVRGLRSERHDHLGIVAGVCQEIGLAAYLDALAEPSEQRVSVGTATVALDPVALERAVRRQACFLVATNVLDSTVLLDQELVQTYKGQTSVERGFAFLKVPLFLASSVFVKKPERIVALSLVMVLCLLVYRLAEHRLREQLAATGQTVPNQLSKPTERPTLRWIFQCFEGISLLTLPQPAGPPLQVVTELEPLHEQVLALLGPSFEKLYKLE